LINKHNIINNYNIALSFTMSKSKYYADNYINFKINGKDYILSKNITEKMGIFNVIEDCNSSDTLNIDVDLERDDIDDIFNLISGQDIEKDYSIASCIKIITGMKYLTVELRYIETFSKCFIKQYSEERHALAIEIFNTFKTIPYNQEMKYIVKLAIDKQLFKATSHRPEINSDMINIIKNDTYFTNDFKYAIIKLLIAQYVYFSIIGIPNISISFSNEQIKALQEGIKIVDFRNYEMIANNLKEMCYKCTSNIIHIEKMEISVDSDNNWIMHINDQKYILNNDIYTYGDELENLKIPEDDPLFSKITVIPGLSKYIVKFEIDKLDIRISEHEFYPSFIHNYVMSL
jgi:hypothetical protein